MSSPTKKRTAAQALLNFNLTGGGPLKRSKIQAYEVLDGKEWFAIDPIYKGKYYPATLTSDPNGCPVGDDVVLKCKKKGCRKEFKKSSGTGNIGDHTHEEDAGTSGTHQFDHFTTSLANLCDRGVALSL